LQQGTTGQGFPQSDEWIDFFLEESYKNIEWFTNMGAEVGGLPAPFGVGGWIPFFPHFPGAEGVASETSFYWLPTSLGVGRNWYFLQDQINERTGITMMYNTKAYKLIQNPNTKEILGVVSEDSNGDDVYVKARKGVIVCNGGYEWNADMIREYIHIPRFITQGSPYNTGDGIKMCMAVGADLRNMGAFAAPTYDACKFDDYKSGVPFNFPSAGACIMVGANNKRFRDEYRSAVQGISNREIAGKEGTYNGVGSIMENGVYVRDKYPLPIHVIFDETARLSKKLFGSSMSWSNNIEGYTCSDDNSVELELGWMTKADTIEELATKLGREEDSLMWRVPLTETISKWNESCAAGKDLEFNTGDENFTAYKRDDSMLNPFTEGPFYAVELLPDCLNTQGGMVRNLEGQVIDVFGEVIPRLYSAGENGGFWNHLYQCMSNVGSDCYGMGRVSGKNAANLDPWE
jgi:succinate dehydrogenase/fumarate reductase flavoprotein subunit